LEPTCVLNIHSHDIEHNRDSKQEVIIYNPLGDSSPLLNSL
jgi:hypothetical protein